MNKREFFKLTTLAMGASILPMSNLWAATNKKRFIRTAHIGVGNMGLEDLKAISSHGNVRVTALCDVDAEYLKAAHQLFPDAKIFSDYRELFKKMHKKIDAVVVSTPDHTHAPASLMAMNYRKAVYCQKPLTHYVAESREMRRIAQEKGVVTQMGIQVHSFYDYKLATLLIRGGIIGKVSKVIAWSNKNWGFDGKPPATADPIPERLNWNLWLGTSAERPYNKGYYHPGNWRKLMDYGCATLGDMGVHIFDTPYNALELGVPNTITNHCRPSTGYGYPERNVVHYTFDGTPYTTSHFEWVWYDGVAGPEKTVELSLPNDASLPDQGAMFIGENGKRLLLPHFMQLPQLIVNGAFVDYSIVQCDTTKSLGEPVRDYGKESPRHYHEFIDACLGKSTCSAPFEYASKLTETILLGVIAGRFAGQTLHYDKEKSLFREADANNYLTGEYRLF